MQMTFYTSSSVTLLFEFWEVHGVAGMLLSVLVVFLLTLTYETLKVTRIWLDHHFKCTAPPPAGNRSPSLEGCQSESSLTPIASTQPPPPVSTKHSVLFHGVQAGLHTLQVVLGYMLMLCVMSYNTWIFLAVVCGSVLGYYILFPVASSMSNYANTI
ncbi:hypothetical protein NQD34_009149 [Periophthalmus magnuspinnatus]|uniref:probable low affinity copper uptake protein 2 n=1 Tax=Periophthalmus magnuspinnatus TaxID=409849 RepID=UPI00145C0E19|nr:probable low affinity copper uptake protein 2 [Periophthalmus magnuspinnatus]KAJ0015529.1 hypothetical protein NQD34_009149 [Periophthalmus magnuspinnatus]